MSSFCTNCGTENTELLGEDAQVSAKVDQGDIVPGITKTIIDETLTADKFRILTSCQVTCLQPGIIEVLHKPDLGIEKRIASGRIGPGRHDFNFSWFPYKTIAPLGNVKVVFTLHPWAAASDVEAFLQGTSGDA